MCSKVKIVVVLRSLHSSPTALPCLLPPPPPPLPPPLFYCCSSSASTATSTAASAPAVAQCHCRCRWQLAAHKSAAARRTLRQLVRCRSSNRRTVRGWRCIRRQFLQLVRISCEGFEGDSAGQDRIDCSFSTVCAKLRA